MTTSERIRPRLRPLSLGEILDVSIKICIAHWRTLLKAVLLVVVPVQIVATIINADYTVESFDFGTSSAQTSEQTIEQFNQYLGDLAIATVLQLLAMLLVTVACFRVIAQAYLGEDTDWRSSLAYAVRLMPPLLALTLLYALGVLLGFVLLVLPGIWLFFAWALATPALLVEGLRGRRALGRSFELVKGRWWRTFGVLVIGFILATIISTIAEAVFIVGIFAGEGNDVLVLVLSAIAGIVGLAVSTPFQAALITVVYFDLRVRKEGFDLELLAREIGGTVQPGAVGAAPSAVLPPVEEVDRGDAPFWPPPPGWKPPPCEDETAADAAGQERQLPRDEPPPPDVHPPPDALAPPDEPPPQDEPPRLPGVPHG